VFKGSRFELSPDNGCFDRRFFVAFLSPSRTREYFDEDKMGGACSMTGEEEEEEEEEKKKKKKKNNVYRYWWESQKERDHQEDQDGGRWIILR
jgi:hypothetical protein